MEKEKKVIELDKIYHLDISALAPIEVETIFFTDDGVMCNYLSSFEGRREVIDYKLFEMNGIHKPTDE